MADNDDIFRMYEGEFKDPDPVLPLLNSGDKPGMVLGNASGIGSNQGDIPLSNAVIAALIAASLAADTGSVPIHTTPARWPDSPVQHHKWPFSDTAVVADDSLVAGTAHTHRSLTIFPEVDKGKGYYNYPEQGYDKYKDVLGISAGIDTHTALSALRQEWAVEQEFWRMEAGRLFRKASILPSEKRSEYKWEIPLVSKPDPLDVFLQKARAEQAAREARLDIALRAVEAGIPLTSLKPEFLAAVAEPVDWRLCDLDRVAGWDAGAWETWDLRRPEYYPELLLIQILEPKEVLLKEIIRHENPIEFYLEPTYSDPYALLNIEPIPSIDSWRMPGYHAKEYRSKWKGPLGKGYRHSKGAEEEFARQVRQLMSETRGLHVKDWMRADEREHPLGMFGWLHLKGMSEELPMGEAAAHEVVDRGPCQWPVKWMSDKPLQLHTEPHHDPQRDYRFFDLL